MSEKLERYFEVDVSASGMKGHYVVVGATEDEAKVTAAKRWVQDNIGALTIDCKELKPVRKDSV